MVFIGGGPVSSEYARAVKIERETREREKRLERRDRRERNEGPENSYTVKVLVLQTSLDSNVFNCPGTVPTFLLPSPGLVKTRGRGRCILSGRRSRRRRSTASPLHDDALEPLEFFIFASFQPVLENFVSLLCHLLLLKLFRSSAALARRKSEPRANYRGLASTSPDWLLVNRRKSRQRKHNEVRRAREEGLGVYQFPRARG